MAIQTVGSVNTVWTGNTQSYQAAVNAATQATQSASAAMTAANKQSVIFSQTIDNLGANMGTGFAGSMAAFKALVQPMAQIHSAINLSADLEMTTVAFKTMLQSADAADRMIKDLVKFAAETPLQLAGASATAKMLLQFGVEAGDIISTLRMLGDAASGDQNRMTHLALAFGQMTAAGRLMGQDLLQMINAGFNPLQELARTSGKSMAELREEMEKGHISAAMIGDAFKSATSEGGKFFNGMLEQSKTFSGLMSTMKDDLDAFKRAFGKFLIDVLMLKESIQGVSAAAQFMTQQWNDMTGVSRDIITALVLLTAGMLALVRIWRVGAIFVGLVVWSWKDAYKTIKWLVGGIYAWIAAQFTSTATAAANTAAVNANTAAKYINAEANATMAGLFGVSTAASAANTTATVANTAAVTANAAATNAAAAATGRWAALSLGARAGIIGLGVAVAGTAVALGVGLGSAMSNFNSQISESNRIRDEWSKRVKDGTQWIINDARAVDDNEEAQRLLNKAITDSETEMKGLEAGSAKARKAMQDLHWTTDELFSALGSDTDYDVFKDEMRKLSAKADDFRGRISDLRKELKRLKDEPLAAAQKAVADLNRHMLEEIETFGMDADEKRRWKAVEAGATDEMLAQVDVMVAAHQIYELDKKKREAIVEATKKQMDATGDLLKHLKEESETMGMTDKQKELYKLSTMAMSQEEAEYAKTMIESNAAKKENLKLLEEGKQITKEYLTPQQKFKARMEELDSILKAGGITTDVYAKAVKAARDELDGVKGSADAASSSIRELNATASGSAEALSRYAAYQEMIGKQEVGPLKRGIPEGLPAPGFVVRGGVVNEELFNELPTTLPGIGRPSGYMAELTGGQPGSLGAAVAGAQVNPYSDLLMKTNKLLESIDKKTEKPEPLQVADLGG